MSTRKESWRKIKIIPGQKFNHLTIIKELEPVTYLYKKTGGIVKTRYVECLCDCGNIRKIQFTRVKTGLIKDCGKCPNKHNKKWKEVEIGKRFGRLVIISEEPPKILKSGKARIVTCKCDCGTIKQYQLTNLGHNHTTSCGCFNKENLPKYTRTHGKTRTFIYRLYKRLRAYCNNPKSICYKNIGGKGIKFCERWNDFSNFLLDIPERPSEKHYLGRIDINKDFEPGNVIWTTTYPVNKTKLPKKIKEKKPRPPRLIWTKEKCQEEALKYRHRWEFGENCKSAYCSAIKYNWLDEICSHMEVIKHPKYTKEECHQEALKYNTRTEFQNNSKGAYATSCKNNWIDEVCSHMRPPMNITKRLVYSYVFPDNVIYVGLTCNEVRRDNDHMGRTKKQTPVSKYIEKTNIIPIKNILSDGYIDVEKARKLETDTINHYKNIGWTLLNTYGGGQTGGVYRYTKTRCREEALKYDNIHDFKKERLNFYGAILRHKWVVELTAHMSRRTNQGYFKKPKPPKVKKKRQLPDWAKENIRQRQLGKKQSQESIDKRREKMKGRTVSQETRDKIRNTLKGRPYPQEVRDKIKNTYLLKKNTPI